MNELKKKKENYDISSIKAASDNEDTAKQVISKDKKTQLAILTLTDKNDLDSKGTKIKKVLHIPDLKVYVTGADVLNDDFSKTTEEGIKKTEIIAAVFIFIVLVLVFRSPIVPILSLTTVGISLVVSLNIIMNLANSFDFPISNFTQVFLVVVLFGIGTDYNILLYDHFKEELSTDLSVEEATRNARRKAGRTILYSGSSVLIGFAVLALAKFSFYQSAVGVSIGVAVLLLNLLTLNPFFMRNLGKRMFWPSRNFEGTSHSRLWQKLSKTAIARPLVTLFIIDILTVPFGLTYKQNLNYNNADGIPDHNSAKQGYLTIQKHFSAGMMAPSTLYLESKRTLTNQEDLAVIDQLTSYLSKEKGIKTVTSVTRPSGDKITALYLNQQLSTLESGLKDSISGLDAIKSGLSEADAQLRNADNSQQMGSVQQLAEGSNTLNQGINQLLAGINQYTEGVGTLSSGINQLNQGVGTLGGASQMSTGLAQINNQLMMLSDTTKQLADSSGQLASSGETLKNSTADIASGMNQLNSGIQEMSNQLSSLNQQVASLAAGLTTAEDSLAKVQEALTSIEDYLSELKNSPIGNTFYIPKANLEKNILQKSYDMYLSKNQKIAKFTIVLKHDPNTLASANDIKRIRSDIEARLKDTSLSDTKVAIGGQTAQTSDLESTANSDFTRTAIIMLAGIGIALIAITHSVIQPLSIIATLLIAYVGSLGITNVLSKLLLGKDMLTWNTPFFTFIMLIALGVDYSIFLMMRYREERKDRSENESILNASTATGIIVLSAAVILGGTFAALIPSGVTTLIQVAFAVIIGLSLLIILLPLVSIICCYFIKCRQ